MKKILCCLALLAAAIVMNAQIALTIRASHPNYMLYDAVYIQLRMKNYSSSPLTFGASDKLHGELKFIIMKPDGTIAKRLPVRKVKDLITGAEKNAGPENYLEGLILASGTTSREIVVNLADYYSLQQLGTYTICAEISHPKIEKKYQSNKVTFSVRKGMLVWTRQFGMPDYVGVRKGTIPTRSYSLYKFHDGRSMAYYVVIDDLKQVYFVKKIGFDLGGGNLEPQCEIDAMGRLHLLIAVSSKVFAYYIYDYTGRLADRIVYMKTSTTPFLISNPADASVIVTGGRLAKKDVDYEELKALPLMDELQPQNEVENAFELPDPKKFGSKKDPLKD